jgi:hypothetical protein
MRELMRIAIFAGVWFSACSTIVLGDVPATNPAALSADLSSPIEAPRSGYLKMGGKNPQGVEINANSRYLTLGGKPWFPVMGEFHYVRVPHEEWENELLKMKADGITVVSTYVIWIYHEEAEGQFDWTGDRNLREFVQLCAKHGLYVYARLGPWCHGEVRNGGLPDWVLQKCKVIRRDDPTFMGYTATYYDQIHQQLAGLLWKDGGPVIGVQLDNETGNSPQYLLALKKLAIKVGFDVPIYSMTGWDHARGPADEMIPFYGGYPDGFWFNENGVAREGRREFFFTPIRDDSEITDSLIARRGTSSANLAGVNHYPYLTCELGGGMATAYARRPIMTVDDVAAQPLVKIGSGANSAGYYMFHGGSDLIGKLTTLQETQATNYPNDLPPINYDFQAPLGQFGQIRPSYRALRMLHTFLADFGGDLAPMATFFPKPTPQSIDDTQTLRWAVRSDGHRGFVFINNYERGNAMADHPQTQFTVRLADGSDQVIPANPVDIPSGSYMIWPFNLDLNGVRLRSASAQLLCRIDGDVPTYVFFALPGVEPQFDFGASVLSGLKPGTDCLTPVHASDGRQARILLLTRDQALQCCKAELWGAERLVISSADLIPDGSTLHLQSSDVQNFSFSVYPQPANPPEWNGRPLSQSPEGVFTRYSATVAPKKIDLAVRETNPGGPAREIRLGKRMKPEEPSDADFDDAQAWQVTIPHDALDGVQNVLLRVDYAGDAARAYIGDRFIDDEYYNGLPWDIGLKRFAPDVLEKGLTLKFLPLRSDSPVYIQEDRRPKFDENGQALQFRSIEPIVVYDLAVQEKQ